MRLNENNTFIGINPPYQLSVIHSSKLIYPREIYQRGVERKRVELIARDFNEYIVNEPKVSFRNGRYYVMDGQHTIEGCILLNGGRHELDTILLQLGLVPGTVVAVPGKTVKLPDQHNVKQLFVAVFYHLLKLRAVVRFGRDGTVNVVLDDGDAILFRIGSAFTNLAFNGFFALVIR